MTTTQQDALSPYRGPWTAAEARHLLRRTVFGPPESMVEEAVALGLDGTIDRLLSDRPAPAPPVKQVPDPGGEDDFTPNALYDPDVAYGETWVNAPVFPSGNLRPMERNRILRYRRKSLSAWSFLLIQDGSLSIRERLTWFWHNHFVVSDLTLAQRGYLYWALLREQALGNARTFTKRITIDTGMLRYLNGADNTRRAPNENYARELLELFTVGKGALAGPGDYTTFTEEDVVAMAQVLTGWQVPPDRRGNTLEATFAPSRHTEGDKRLSHRFGNALIREAGEREYEHLIDIIFEQPACAPFLVSELHRWFVGSAIDEAVEQPVIAPLAAIFRDADYEIRPLLRALLGSEHFFAHRGCMIKSPVDLLLSATQGLGAPVPNAGPQEDYDQGTMLYKSAGELGMAIFEHPTVAGWEAYHQAPQYDHFWLNNLTYPRRQGYLATLIAGGTITTESESFRIDPVVPVLDVVAGIENADDPNRLVYTLAQRMYCFPITEAQKDHLKDLLIPGLPDYEWTVEYGDYLANPNGPLRAAVQARLEALFTGMVHMPEFQLM